MGDAGELIQMDGVLVAWDGKSGTRVTNNRGPGKGHASETADRSNSAMCASGLGRVKTLQRGIWTLGMPRKWQARFHPHALMAAISDLMPIIFITRVRL